MSFTKRSRNQFHPRVEILEDRRTPSTFDGTTLKGGQGQNNIVIHDLGAAGVTIECDGDFFGTDVTPVTGAVFNIEGLQQKDTICSAPLKLDHQKAFLMA